MVFDRILDPIFSPLLKLDPLLAILIISFAITLLINIIYKLATDQKEMKELKTKQKEFQKKMKKLRDNPKKMMEMQKESMESSMKYMSKSMKPTLYTLIPIIIIFGWLSANLGYIPIDMHEEFTVNAMFSEGVEGEVELSTIPESIVFLSNKTQNIEDGHVVWQLKAEERGDYTLLFRKGTAEVEQDMRIDEYKSSQPVEKHKNSVFIETTVSYTKIKPLAFTGIPWVKDWGWIGAYILFSIVISIVSRRLMGIY